MIYGNLGPSRGDCQRKSVFAHRPLSSSFSGLPYRILLISHKKELTLNPTNPINPVNPLNPINAKPHLGAYGWRPTRCLFCQGKSANPEKEAMRQEAGEEFAGLGLYRALGI